jgi:hypothetical protein
LIVLILLMAGSGFSKGRKMIYTDEKLESIKALIRKEIAKDCEAAIEHEIDMISSPMDEDDYTGFRNLRTAFENIMKVIRGENE